MTEIRASLRSGASSNIAVVHKSQSELSEASRATINATYDFPSSKERSQSRELAEGDHEELRHIDVKGPELDGELVLTNQDSDSKEVEFGVNDGGQYNICVKIVWGVEEG
ncbi:hypothetical protein BOTCAL_0059g00190 [Botryotinia calthae]|uniref:Uncharacterized protein n=1 Tax=Botryotinia calthae TaxID=38488 RepID=A0A4Y8DAG7_9HELO|nr:hypothetical protein BOTCAL_0059g00190 [Botryotinia calthae]